MRSSPFKVLDFSVSGAMPLDTQRSSEKSFERAESRSRASEIPGEGTRSPLVIIVRSESHESWDFMLSLLDKCPGS